MWYYTKNVNSDTSLVTLFAQYYVYVNTCVNKKKKEKERT